MSARLLRILTLGCAITATSLFSRPAAATDPVVVVVDDDHDHDDGVEVVETVEVHDHHHHESDGDQAWFGIHAGGVTTPLRPDGNVTPGRRVTSNPFKACLDPFGERYCSAMRGFDLRLQYYETRDAWHYPRWVGYFRTGYTAGRATFDPSDEGGYQKGDATSLSYYAVPLFFGGSVYLFDKFPVRPYGGLGFGFDIVKLRYGRHEDRAILDASARIGFELHAGLEARISNVVALTAEVQQLWSARRKLDGVPDFSNQGLTIMTGIAISIPSRHKKERPRHHHHHHKTIKRVKRSPAAAPASPPAVVAPAPAPAPTTATATAPVQVEVNQTVNAAPTVETPAATPPPEVQPAPAPAPTTAPTTAATPPPA